MGARLNAWQIANLVDDIASPDSESSPGGAWLREVWRSAQANLDDIASFEGAYLCDLVHEWADGDVPIYTAQRFAVWTDLAAWSVDISDYACGMDVEALGDANLMETLAGYALFVVAEAVYYAAIDDRGWSDRCFDVIGDDWADDDDDEDNEVRGITHSDGD